MRCTIAACNASPVPDASVSTCLLWVAVDAGQFNVSTCLRVSSLSRVEYIASAIVARIKERGSCVLESFGKVPAVVSLKVMCGGCGFEHYVAWYCDAWNNTCQATANHDIACMPANCRHALVLVAIQHGTGFVVASGGQLTASALANRATGH
eukprot:364003-Chlamydomonas_euryale.AAC.9